MAKTIIEVNTNTLKSDVSNIEARIRSLRSEAANLRNTADQLGSMWEGPAKQAFMAAVQADLSKLENLIKAMERFTNQTSECQVEYDKCEQAVSSIISSIRV